MSAQELHNYAMIIALLMEKLGKEEITMYDADFLDLEERYGSVDVYRMPEEPGITVTLYPKAPIDEQPKKQLS